MLGNPGLNYMGYRVSAARVLPLPSHLAAIQDFPRPYTVKELQSFLGMVNFYRRFLPGVACTLHPLTDKLSGSRKVSEQKVPITVTFYKYHSFWNIP
jgi:hypothetical protein